MDNQNSPERTLPPQCIRNSRAFRQFKNPPQPHMCIQDTIKNTNEKLYINVLGWQKIANPKQFSDPIPLYGGMQVPQGCGPNSTKSPLLVFAVMVNPDILKANGKNAANSMDRDALVSLLCDFVEAMNPGLFLTRNPVILKDRDLAGELKDVWLAVQNKREREKGLSQDVMYKVYDIDGIGSEDVVDEDRANPSNTKNYNNISGQNHQNKDSENTFIGNANKQSLISDQKTNNSRINQDHRRSYTLDNKNQYPAVKSVDTSFMSIQEQPISSQEHYSQIRDVQEKFSSRHVTGPSTSYGNDCNSSHKTGEGWNEFSKRDISSIKANDNSRIKNKLDKSKKSDIQMNNGKSHYNFYPVFDNKISESVSSAMSREIHVDTSSCKVTDDKNMDNEKSKIIIEPMQKLVLHSTDKKICDNKKSALSSMNS
ncbi:PIH1 domain-containing protein 2 [Eumeta japonica]|uniref:PIH1 domain-containing protein 2 n=1 Tax=Eumeta variegata TaxID=151549 RepID=A0A4C1ZKX0_EUMVA|nr:PIH1 domain-containing protein 2 [Eumeta japonica]